MIIIIPVMIHHTGEDADINTHDGDDGDNDSDDDDNNRADIYHGLITNALSHFSKAGIKSTYCNVQYHRLGSEQMGESRPLASSLTRSLATLLYYGRYAPSLRNNRTAPSQARLAQHAQERC